MQRVGHCRPGGFHLAVESHRLWCISRFGAWKMRATRLRPTHAPSAVSSVRTRGHTKRSLPPWTPTTRVPGALVGSPPGRNLESDTYGSRSPSTANSECSVRGMRGLVIS